MTNIDQEKWLESNAFFCEYHRARITEKVCSGLQEQARKELEYVKPMKLSACWRCEKMEKRSNVQNVRDVRIVKKEEETMSKKGTCANCGREQMLPAVGHCYLCYNASRYLTGADREAALQAVKERIAAGKIRGKRPSPQPSLGARQVAEKIIEKELAVDRSPVTERKQPKVGRGVPIGESTRRSPSAISLVISFVGDDLKLYEGLLARARRERRDPDQQLLFLLSHQLLLEVRTDG